MKLYITAARWSACWLYIDWWDTGLTHWGRVTHISVSELTIIGSDNRLSPGRRQAIIWTNAGILWTWPLGTSFSEILIEIHAFSFKKMQLKMSSGKWRPIYLGLNVLRRTSATAPLWRWIFSCWITPHILSINMCLWQFAHCYFPRWCFAEMRNRSIELHPCPVKIKVNLLSQI